MVKTCSVVPFCVCVWAGPYLPRLAVYWNRRLLSIRVTRLRTLVPFNDDRDGREGGGREG